MKLEIMEKITGLQAKRLGRGHGSGRGKTGGRGTKGQNARGKVSLSFEGGALPLIKRIPFRRGKGRFKGQTSKPVIISLDKLNTLGKGAIVDIDTLVKKNLVNTKDAKKYGVKILGTGAIEVAVTLKLPASKSAVSKIEKAGGKVIPALLRGRLES